MAKPMTPSWKVRVDRSRSPQEVLDATGRRQYVDPDVLATMPKGSGEDVEFVFFSLGRRVDDAELEREYVSRGLVPDPYAQAQVNADDPTFADQHPNGTHWKDADGNWCFATFFCCDVAARYVSVLRCGNVWRAYWWFGGVRK